MARPSRPGYTGLHRAWLRQRRVQPGGTGGSLRRLVAFEPANREGSPYARAHRTAGRR